jgi:hypothetical protein
MRRAGRQNQGRFDFAEILVLHGWDAVEASPRCNALRPEFLAAPRANEEIPTMAPLLAEQIQRLDGLIGQAYNSARREHQTLAHPIGQTLPPPTTARPGTQPIPKISAAPDLFQARFKRGG